MIHCRLSGIELEEEDVAIRHCVLLPFLAILAGFFDGRLITKFLDVTEMVCFGHDETLLEIRVDDTSSLRCEPSFS